MTAMTVWLVEASLRCAAWEVVRKGDYGFVIWWGVTQAAQREITMRMGSLQSQPYNLTFTAGIDTERPRAIAHFRLSAPTQFNARLEMEKVRDQVSSVFPEAEISISSPVPES